MPVGQQSSANNVNNQLTTLAIGLRDVMHQIAELSEFVNGQGNGLAVLQALGFGSTANPANPGGVSDAQQALNMLSYLNTPAAVYFGTATQTSAFNFDQELSQLWAGN
jgi:hypothetical protein